MKIYLAQINTIIGDFEYNYSKISDEINKAKRQGCSVIIFPELAVCGYPPRDLLDRRNFINKVEEYNNRLIDLSDSIYIIIGTIRKNWRRGKHIFNSALVINNKKIKKVYHKRLLPYYDVFDEERYFEPGKRAEVVRIENIKFGITICEDIWTDIGISPRYKVNPIKECVDKGAQYIINLSASPFHINKDILRYDLINADVRNYNVSIIYLNSVGAQDELIFDGNSFIIDKNNGLVLQLDSFKEDARVFSTDNTTSLSLQSFSEEENITNALTLGIKDYFLKTGFKKAVIGLSGGIDSALVCSLATMALNEKNVYGIAMPSRFSSKESLEDASELANNLNINFLKIEIEPIFDAFLKVLKPVFQNMEWDITEENIQARIRGTLLMAFANKFSGIVLATGNKSELAVGYCTLYGDMCGGLAPIGDLPKTDVYRVSKYIASKIKSIPERCFTKPPSAELRDNQKDSDSLPDYNILDSILNLYIENLLSYNSIINLNHKKEDIKKTLNLIYRSEYKRRQAPPVLKITSKAFGTGRRIPIVQRFGD